MSTLQPEKRILTVGYMHQGGRVWPFIRLCGKWLRELGFTSGSKIEVEGSNGLLLIRLLPKPP